MTLPSGDHAGSVSWAVDFVNCLAALPSSDCTQISKFPARSDAYAIDLPSGENVASVCRPGSNVRRVSGRSTVTCALGGTELGRRIRDQMPIAINAAPTTATDAITRARRVLFALAVATVCAPDDA